MKAFLAIPIIVLLAGCTTLDREKAFLVTCDSYAESLDKLADLRADGKLKPDEVKTIEQIRIVTTPICTGPPPIDLSSALNAAVRGADALLVIKKAKE